MKDYYKILGVAKNATQAEISNAYRQLARKYHPDVCPNDAEALSKFKEAAEAHEVLGDPEKRQRYDNPVDPMHEFMSSFFGRPRKNSNRDLHSHIVLTFAESITGCSKTINVLSKDMCTECQGKGWHNTETCRDCNGTGSIVVNQNVFKFSTQCGACNGTGRTNTDKCVNCNNGFISKQDEIITVKIAKAVANGAVLRLKEKGDYHAAGRGDLYLNIHVEEHPVFQRSGLNVHYKMPVSYAWLTLGKEISVPTIYGTVKTNIEPGTPNGARLKIKHKGFHDERGNKGDLFITFAIPVPVNAAPEYVQKLKELAELEEKYPLADVEDFAAAANI